MVSLRIAYISQSDPNAKDAQSGEIYRIYEKLQDFGEVVSLAPFVNKFYFHLRVINKISRLFLHKGYNFAFNLRNARNTGEKLSQRLGRDNFNLIFAAYASRQLAFLETSIPIISVADATFNNLVDYYPGFSNLLNFSQQEGNLIEQRAINRANHLIFTSEWAANSAIRDYAAPLEKVHVIHFGPNLKRIPPRPAARTGRDQTCNLLFVGREWERKGGDLAVAAAAKLVASDLNAQLTVVGCRPPGAAGRHIRVIPHLNKNLAEEARTMDNLYAAADFLVLPTRADCAPLVVNEANAFGVPVIATHTGGLPSLIREGANGYLLPRSAKSEDYARVIATVFADKKTYNKLRQTSRQEYDQRLSWEVWSRDVARIIHQVRP